MSTILKHGYNFGDNKDNARNRRAVQLPYQYKWLISNSAILLSRISSGGAKRGPGGSDCNPGIGFSIPGSGIEKVVIPGCRFGIRLTDWSLFWYPQLTYFMHRTPTKGISEL